MVSLKFLVGSLILKKIDNFKDLKVKGITYNSQKAGPGCIFVCLEGTRHHGTEFIPQAVERGAIAVLTDKEVEVKGATRILVPEVREALAAISARYYGLPSTRLRMIGVTGTNGKTTTSHLINALLEAAGEKTGLIGTIKYKIGDKNLPVLATTPESSDLQEYLFRMVQEDVKYVSIEVSSHALELKRTAGCDFDIAVLTNVSEDHLDFHQTFERYLHAKGKLFSRMGELFEKQGMPKAAVINRDDLNFEYFYRLTGVQKVTYGIKNDAHVRAKNIAVRDNGVSFYVESPWGQGELNLKLTGMFSVYNALAALTTAMIEGIDWNTCKRILENISGVAGRFEKIDLGQDFTVIVDYAHTPDGLENVLKTIQKFARARVITVFGCGGDRDRTKRAPMGEIAAKYSDFCILTSDNPRTEDPWQIFHDVEPGLQKSNKRNQYVIYLDRYQAIYQALDMAREGDVVLIAGKGHEDYQVFKDKTIEFDDRKVVREILIERLKR